MYDLYDYIRNLEISRSRLNKCIKCRIPENGFRYKMLKYKVLSQTKLLYFYNTYAFCFLKVFIIYFCFLSMIIISATLVLI